MAALPATFPATPAAMPLPGPAPPEIPLPQQELAVVEEECHAAVQPTTVWEGSFELGLNGTSGNTETFDFRCGFDAKRETRLRILSLDLDYSKKTADGRETANRAFLDWRLESVFGDSRINTFVHGTTDYNEFQAFDVRVTVDLGLGYDLIKTDTTKFTARAGSGFSQEYGSPDEDAVPEAAFGLDFMHKLGKRQKVAATVDYTPDVTEFGDYRINSKASWEAVVSEAWNLSLKLSVLDRYDSTPNGRRPNDLDYSAVLLWKF